jgi:hypothetical protein
MPPTVPTTTAEAQAALEAAIAGARALAESLTPDQLNWQPSPGRWSVGQCLEHLTVTADRYAGAIGVAITKAQSNAEGAPAEKFRLSLWGRFFVWALTAPGKRFPAPKQFAPPSSADDGTLRAFEGAHKKLIVLLKDVAARPLARLKTSSPVTRLIRLNVADCFVILAIHSHRHLQQAKRVMESPTFPAAA